MSVSSPLTSAWAALDGDAAALDAVVFEGAAGLLPSVYAVAEAASAQIAVATLALAELHAARTGSSLRRVRVDRRHVAAAFRSERFLRAANGDLPVLWDPIAGDYPTSDGWIRLHTNYAHHRAAALRVLGTPCEKPAVARAVASREGDALETAVVAEGGCAAVMRTGAEWRAHAQGQAVAREPLVGMRRERVSAASFADMEHAGVHRPLDGVRVLDLTRVIAGPVCTRVLSAHGAEVMRIDPPGFDEMRALLGDSTGGKRRVALDLHAERDRRTFERLVGEAHVLVSGYRGGVLERLGYGAAALRAKNPGLILASLNAYGVSGPWADRRGFDSLVQMSCGIAARGGELARAGRPVPLPAQALDHGTGYLLAAAVGRALTRLVERREASVLHLSLARTAQWLMELGDQGDATERDATVEDARPFMESVDTAWGTIERVRCPGSIDGIASGWTRAPGPLGTDPPEW